MTTGRPSKFITSFVVASRYMPVYLAVVLLMIVATLWVPNTFNSVGWSFITTGTGILAIAALGQMLVIMTGGIDLSVPGTLTFGALVLVGVSQSSDERLWMGIFAALAVGAMIGLVNGLLIGGLKLNALIVTLAVGQVVVGMVNLYTRTFPIQSPVPPVLNEWARIRYLNVSVIFWVGVAVMLLFVLAFRFTAFGRRFQAVGANPVAARVSGIKVTGSQMMAYVIAGALYAGAGVLAAANVRTPSVGIGMPYLLGPIAAVVIGGAALTGGLASPLSTWAAAFFLTGLNHMMRVLGLPTALQFVVFGVVVIGGMLISGDRIIKGVEHVFRERGSPGSGDSQAMAKTLTGTG